MGVFSEVIGTWAVPGAAGEVRKIWEALTMSVYGVSMSDQKKLDWWAFMVKVVGLPKVKEVLDNVPITCKSRTTLYRTTQRQRTSNTSHTEEQLNIWQKTNDALERASDDCFDFDANRTLTESRKGFIVEHVLQGIKQFLTPERKSGFVTRNLLSKGIKYRLNPFYKMGNGPKGFDKPPLEVADIVCDTVLSLFDIVIDFISVVCFHSVSTLCQPTSSASYVFRCT